MFGNLYANVAASQSLFWVILFLAFWLGVVVCMIGGTVRNMFLDWREDRAEAREEAFREEDAAREALVNTRISRREAQAEADATRILAGLHPERYPTAISNEEYHTGEQRRTLGERWRTLVDETRPRSPEIVAENVYRENTYAFRPVRAELTSRSWPEWTEQERATPGRHRADPTWDLDALNTPTGSFRTVERRELVSV